MCTAVLGLLAPRLGADGRFSGLVYSAGALNEKHPSMLIHSQLNPQDPGADATFVWAAFLWACCQAVYGGISAAEGKGPGSIKLESLGLPDYRV